MDQNRTARDSIAIVGGGPGGLVVAKYLKQHGFEPVIFEQGDGIGGQWNAGASHSGVWPSMCTNTSQLMTCFSDFRYKPNTAVFPSNQDVLSYLRGYAAHFDLIPHIRLQARVTLVEREASAGWTVHFKPIRGEPRSERFRHVVIASGRYSKPMIPPVPGIELFAGAGGVIHTFNYKDPDRYRGERVLVAGSSISALEVASDLAMLGSRVISAGRRPRYVLQKLMAGVPTDNVAFTRFSALAAEVMPLHMRARTLKDFVLRTSGSPERFGALKPAENIFEAGIAQSQYYLPLVAEGRIVTKPWIAAVEDQTVHFADGSAEKVDAIIFGTGFELHLPFLSEEILRTLQISSDRIELHQLTFHPDLANLAFVGLFPLIGPYLPVLELQARWIAYVWSGLRPAPARKEMEADIAAFRVRRGGLQEQLMDTVAIRLAREAGIEPVLQKWPELAGALLFGPLSSVSFRLNGPDSLPDAAERLASSALEAIPSLELLPEQQAKLKVLAAARKDEGLLDLANRGRRTPTSVASDRA